MESLQAADEGTLFWFENHHSPVGDVLMKFFTHCGDAPVAISVVLVGMVVFALAGRRRTAVILMLGSLLGLALTGAISHTIPRERPDVAWRLIPRPHTASFPSGHSLNSMAIYGSLALLAARHVRRRLWANLIRAAGFALPLLIGISRPYLGVHYPSDVIAGWTGGLACALLTLWVDQRWGDRPCVTPALDPPSAPQTFPSAEAGSEAIHHGDQGTGIRRPTG